jgi:hypothetical protein
LNQTNLANLFLALKESGRTVRYGDLLRAGVPAHTIDNAISQYRAFLVRDGEGYSLITFKDIKKGC